MAFLAHLSTAAASQETANQVASKQLEDFRTGQTMVECGAFFRFLAQLATAAGKPNSAEQANNKANGWEMAGMLFILNGSSEEQQFQVQKTIKYISDAKKTEHLSRIELNGEQGFKDIQAEFEKNCMPLVPLQEKAIEVMRKGN